MASSSNPTSSRREPAPPATQPPSVLQLPKPIGKSTDGAKPETQNQSPPPVTPSAVNILSPSPGEVALANSSHLTRLEVVRRRYHHRKQLSRVYRDYYWALMEELKVQYRNYYWQYGVSGFRDNEKAEENDDGEKEEDSDDTNGTNNENSTGQIVREHRCTFVGCKLKAMPLTNFCPLHILSDPRQQLYKACHYVIKMSAQAGPIICAKPILRATMPSLCDSHFQKAQKHINRALKKSGLNSSSSNKLASKFHVIMAEYVRQIQDKRRKRGAVEALKPNSNGGVVIKEENPI